MTAGIDPQPSYLIHQFGVLLVHIRPAHQKMNFGMGLDQLRRGPQKIGVIFQRIMAGDQADQFRVRINAKFMADTTSRF